MDGHSDAKGYPAGRTFGWDADGFIRVDACEFRHVSDIGIGVVLVRWCPPADDGADGVQSVLVIVRAGKQIKSSPPTIL